MAVQQNRKRALRGMRRAHDAIDGPTLTVDETQVRPVADITLVWTVSTVERKQWKPATTSNRL